MCSDVCFCLFIFLSFLFSCWIWSLAHTFLFFSFSIFLYVLRCSVLFCSVLEHFVLFGDLILHSPLFLTQFIFYIDIPPLHFFLAVLRAAVSPPLIRSILHPQSSILRTSNCPPFLRFLHCRPPSPYSASPS